MKQKLPFKVGDLVTYTCSATGIVTDAFITFTCSDYMSVCTHQWDDADTLHGYKQVNVVVPRTYWNTITPRTSNETIKESTI
jgi:hypothetical protein